MDDVGEGIAGYVTPKVAVGAAVGNDAGELLLVQRADSGMWLYPTGWADVGYSAAEVVVKEVREETGIICEPVRLIAVLDGLRLGFTRIRSIPSCSIAAPWAASSRRIPSSAPTWGGSRSTTYRIPLPALSAGAHVFAALQGETVDVLYDRVRQPMWRGDSAVDRGKTA